MVQVQLPLPFSLGPLVKRSRHRPFTAVTGVRFPHGSPLGSLAQLGEHLPYKQRVGGSSPLTSTTKTTHESEWFFFLSLETAGFPGHTRRAALRSVRAAPFSARVNRGYLNRAGMFVPFRAGGFSLRFSEEMRRLRTAGTCRAPRRGKRVDTKVSTLLTPTSFYFLVWRRLPTCDRCETGERQRIFSPVGEHSVLPCRDIFAVPDTVLLHMWFHLRKRDIPVPRNSLTRYTARHLRI